MSRAALAGSSGDLDRAPDAVEPRVPVAGEHRLGSRVGEHAERFGGEVGVGGVRPVHDLGPSAAARPAGDVERHERVAGEEERAILDEERAAAGGVTGGVDYARGPGYVHDLSVRELIELSHRWRPEDPPRDVARHVERVPGPPYVAHHTAVAQMLLAPQVWRVGRV